MEVKVQTRHRVNGSDQRGWKEKRCGPGSEPQTPGHLPLCQRGGGTTGAGGGQEVRVAKVAFWAKGLRREGLGGGGQLCPGVRLSKAAKTLFGLGNQGAEVLSPAVPGGVVPKHSPEVKP